MCLREEDGRYEEGWGVGGGGKLFVQQMMPKTCILHQLIFNNLQMRDLVEVNGG